MGRPVAMARKKQPSKKPAMPQFAKGKGRITIEFFDGDDGDIKIKVRTKPHRKDGDVGTAAQEFGLTMFNKVMQLYQRAQELHRKQDAENGETKG